MPLRDGVRYMHNAPPLAVYILGEDIKSGAAVCQSKNSVNRILQAQADDQSRMPAIGALFNSKLMGQEGLVVPAGVFVNLNRDGDFNPGDQIYVSTNRGKFTREPPSVGTKQVVGVARNENSALLYCVPPQIPVSYGNYEVGNHTIEPTDGTDEITFARDFSVWHAGMLWVEFDLSNVDAGITITGRLKHKIDGTNPKQICRKHVKVGTDESHLTLAGAVTAGQTIELSLQCSAAVADSRTVNHIFIQE